MIRAGPRAKTPRELAGGPERPGFAALIRKFLRGLRRRERIRAKRARGGRRYGGRPPRRRRCSKRLGSRFCWNWSAAGTDRCRLHPRG